MEVLPNCELFYPKPNGTCERQLFKFRFRLRIVTVHSLLFCAWIRNWRRKHNPKNKCSTKFDINSVIILRKVQPVLSGQKFSNPVKPQRRVKIIHHTLEFSLTPSPGALSGWLFGFH